MPEAQDGEHLPPGVIRVVREVFFAADGTPVPPGDPRAVSLEVEYETATGIERVYAKDD